MKRLIGPALMLVALSAALPSHALAQHSGCYVTAHAGGAVSATETSIADLNDGGAITSGLIGGVLGCDVAQARAFAGLWVEGDLYRMHDGSPVLLGTSGATLDRSAAFGARVGYMLTPYTALYAKGGWGWMWTKDLTVPSEGLSFKVPLQNGPVAGFGVETKLLKNLNLDVSYMGWFKRDEAIDAGGTPVNIKDRTDTVRIGLTLRFNEDAPRPVEVAKAEPVEVEPVKPAAPAKAAPAKRTPLK